MSEKTEKNYTVKNIKSEIARVEKSIEKKREKLRACVHSKKVV